MFTQDFIDNFSRLGELLLNWANGKICEPLLDSAIAASYNANQFFTPYMQRHAITTIAQTFLQKQELERWGGNYDVTHGGGDLLQTHIAVIMAGNIPLVGFHDFLSVMATGRGAVIKLSSKDKYLLPAVFEILCRINPLWRERVVFVEGIGGYVSGEAANEPNAKKNGVSESLAALIATGSNATKAAVGRDFANIPLLLRGERFSFAALSGKETEKELEGLAMDVFLYYGLGCRNVNFLFVPKGYDFTLLVESFAKVRTLLSLECYMSVYKRGKAILKMEGESFIDGGFFLLRKSGNMHPNIGEISYSEYEQESEILVFEKENIGEIQKKYSTFGIAQAPLIDEYADNIDTIDFIIKCSCAL